MLADWYFCCCIKSAPTRTKNYLSILDLLDNQPSDSPLATAAMAELTKSEIWMRIHAMPRVLRALRSDLGVSSRAEQEIDQYFSRLLLHLPHEIQPAFNELTAKLRCGTEHGDVLSTMESCARSLRPVDESLLSQTPYLDLNTFLPQTMMLAVLESLATEQSGSVGAILNNFQEGDESLLAGIIEDACQGNLGRMALQLAVRLMSSAPQQNDENLLKALWNQPTTAPQLEADIMQATADLLFAPKSGASSSDIREQMDLMEEELMTFRIWHERVEIYSNTHNERKVLAMLGLPFASNQNRILPLVLWFNAVCGVMVELDPQQAAFRLHPFWTPRPPFPPKALNLKAPFKMLAKRPSRTDPAAPRGRRFSSPSDTARAWLDRWRDDLKLLATAQEGYNNIQIDTTPGRFSFPPAIRWSLFSPWLSFRGKEDRPYPKYSGWNNTILLLRLVAGTWISVRLHCRLGTDPSLNHFSGFLLHSMGVLGGFRHAIPDSVNESLGGLAMAGFELAHNAGIGRYPQIHPQQFLNFLGNSNDVWVAPSENQDVKKIKFQLIGKIFPEIMLILVEDAYPDSYSQDEGAGRWLPCISQVLESFKAVKHHIDHNTKYKLICRFMHTHSHRDVLQRLEERGSWQGDFRNFLLIQDAPPSVWREIGWDEPEQWTDKKSKYQPATPLVRAIERISALYRHGEEGLPPETVEEWRQDFISLINSLSEPKDLYRFIRLRLVQLLRDPTMTKWQDAQISMVRVLLEMSQGQELKILLDAIREMAKTSTAIFDDTITYTILALERLTHAYSRVNRLDPAQTAENPHLAIGKSRKQRWMEDVLLDLLCTVPGEGKSDRVAVNQNLANRLAGLRFQRLTRIGEKTWRLLQCPTRLDHERGALLIPKTEKEFMQWGLLAADWNESQHHATLMVCNQVKSNLPNLFTLSRQDQITALADQTRNDVLARIVALYELTRHSEALYNAGLPYLIKGKISATSSAAVTDFVELELRREGSIWEVFSDKPVMVAPLPCVIGPNDIIPFKVEDSLQPGNTKREFRLVFESGKKGDSPQPPLELWCHDLSWFFQPPTNNNYSGFAVRDTEGLLLPVEGDLLDLVITCFSGPAASEATGVPLTLIDSAENTNADETVSFLFSSAPGLNFRLLGSNFLPEDLTRLLDHLAQVRKEMDVSDLSGLIVTVYLVRNQGFLRLALAMGGSAFDSRNLRWKTLFDKGTELAEQTTPGGGWTINLGSRIVPGFPDRVQVSMHGYVGQQMITEVQITDWNHVEQQINKVKALPITTNDLTPRSGQSMKDLVEDLLTWRKDHLLTITKVLGKPRDNNGTLSCYTAESLALWVEMASLSLHPHCASAMVPRYNNREVTITSLNCWGSGPRPGLITIHRHKLPQTAEEDGRCEGIVTKVPKIGAPQGEGFCEIFWFKSDKVISQGWIQISDIGKVWGLLIPGSKIIGQYHDTGWAFHIVPLYIRALAVWTIDKLPAKDEKHKPLWRLEGITKEYGRLAELSPGSLICLEGQTQVSMTNNLLPNFNGDGSIAKKLPSIVRVTGFPGNPKLQHCRIQYDRDNKFHLYGYYKGGKIPERAELLNISHQLDPIPTQPGKYTITRLFNLRPAVAPGKKALPSQPSRHETWEEWWRKCLAQKEPVAEGKFNAKDRTFTATGTEQIPTAPTLTVPPGNGSFIADAQYPVTGKAFCFEGPNSEPYASFRRVPPSDLNKFFEIEFRDLDSGVEITLAGQQGGSNSREMTLNYVGPVEDEDKAPTPDSECPIHRFEWGYGKILLVPENCLRFKGNTFRAGILSLCHGDQVTKIAFLSNSGQDSQSQDDDEQVAPEYAGLTLDIVAYRISTARYLYSQSKYNLLHILKIVMKNGNLTIISVDTFNDRKCNTDLLSWQMSNAFLDDESIKYLTPRFFDENDPRQSTAKSIHVLGRMNTDLYEEKFGNAVCYSYVRFSFQDSYLGLRLHDGDRVLLECGTISPTNNDWLLALHPPANLLAESDIGQDMENLRLLRRAFSVREDLLPRIHEQGGENALQDERVMVMAQLFPPKANKRFVGIDIKKNPMRPLDSLKALLESQNGIALVCVSHIADDDTGITLELRPAIFVKLPHEHINFCTPGIIAGTVVSVVRSYQGESRFDIKLAMFGQRRYVNNFRPTVVLPMAPLLKGEPWLSPPKTPNGKWWNGGLSFVLGGLPNIQSSLGNYSGGRWEPLPLDKGVLFMQSAFPMLGVASLTKNKNDGREEVKFRPIGNQDKDAWRVGYLVQGKDSFEVQCEGLPGHSITPSGQDQVPWRWLTFGDQAIDEIRERINRETWRYHDRTTSRWPSPAEGNPPAPLMLDPRSSSTGPLFFQIRAELNKQIVLRYSQEKMPTFGFSVETLLSTLRLRQKSDSPWGHYPVAASYSEGGLWIEMSPGRLVELPIQLCRLALGQRSRMMTNFDWTRLALGDFIDLTLVPTRDYFTVEQLMVRWLPGVRSVLGQRCFLPLLSHDDTLGSVTYGAGQFTVTLPSENPSQAPSLILLTPDNHLTSVHPALSPSTGDVVLLGLNPAGRLCVLGLPEFTPKPSLKGVFTDWQDDFMSHCFIWQTKEGWTSRELKTKALIRAVGGAIPVTVQGVDGKQSRLYYTRKHQKQYTTVVRDKCVMMQVLGYYEWEGHVTTILVCGGGLFEVLAKELIKGLPSEIEETAIQTLVTNRADIWVRELGGEHHFSLEEPQPGTLVTDVISIVSSAQISRIHWGLIIRDRKSQALFWLPAMKLAWTVLTGKELTTVFSPDQAKALRVRHMETGASVVDRADILQEFDLSAIGRELTVIVESHRSTDEPDDGDIKLLVRSIELGIFMECLFPVTDGKRQKPVRGVELAVEVIDRHHGDQPMILVTPSGTRRYTVLLPQWFLTLAPPERLILRSCHVQRLKWLRATAEPENIPFDTIENLDGESLERLLCQTVREIFNIKSPLTHSCMAGQEWCRRQKKAKEMDVIPALSVLLIFYACMVDPKRCCDLPVSLIKDSRDKFLHACYRSAFELAHDMGRRAMRSLHVEILLQEFTAQETDRSILRKTGLWPRAWKIASELKPTIEQNTWKGIQRFCDVASFNGTPDEFRIANALSASVGEALDLSRLEKDTEVLRRILNFYRSVPPVQFLEDEEIIIKRDSLRLLEKALDYIRTHGLDLTILSPLPDVVDDEEMPPVVTSNASSKKGDTP